MNLRFSLLLLLAAGIFGVLLHREQQRGTFEAFDRLHREALWKTVSTPPPSWRARTGEGRVLLARLDDPDQPPEQRVFDAWPPGPLEWQVVFQNLKDWNPKAVALALPLTPGRSPETVTKGLAAAAEAVPGLILGVRAAVSERETAPVDLPPELPVLRTRGFVWKVPEFQTLRSLELPLPCGISDVDLGQRLSVKGEWCQVPMLARSGGKIVPALALRALLMWSGISPKEITVEPGRAIRGPDGLEIPIDKAGNFRFHVPLSDAAETVDADDFLFSKMQAETLYAEGSPERAALEKVQSALLWIGADDAASRRLELPGGAAAVSAAELTVRALTLLHRGRMIEPLDTARQGFMQACAIFYGIWLAGRRRRNLWKGLAAGVLLLALLSFMAFHLHRLWLPAAPVLLQLLLAVTAGLLPDLQSAPVHKKIADGYPAGG